jgi:HPt (histidine-containing phosphotransfer) domain-containing protein
MIVDPYALDEYRQIMGEEADEFVNDLITSYLENTPRLFSDLEQALQENDPQTFERAAHTIKSSSATLGAHTLSALAAGMESRAERGSLNGLAEVVRESRQAFVQVEAALQEMYSRL